MAVAVLNLMVRSRTSLTTLAKKSLTLWLKSKLILITQSMMMLRKLLQSCPWKDSRVPGTLENLQQLLLNEENSTRRSFNGNHWSSSKCRQSSLLNNLLREESNRYRHWGTTRDVIEEYVNIKVFLLSWLIRLVSVTQTMVKKIGVERSKKARRGWLVLLVLNSSEPLTEQDRTLLEISQNSNRIILLNKNRPSHKSKWRALQRCHFDFSPQEWKHRQNWRPHQSTLLW